MKKSSAVFSIILLVSLLSACNLPQTGGSAPDANAIATQVAETLAAAAQQTPLASPTAQSSLTPMYTPTTTLTPIPLPGSIEGSISGYPYGGSTPRLTIVAYEQEAPWNYYYIITEDGSTYYSMDSHPLLIPGTWLVVAYDASGNSGGCTTVVTILSDQSTTCDISDWASAYPAKKAGIPNP